MITSLKGRLSLLFLALAVLLAIPAAALADVVKNDIVADTGNNQQEKNYTIGGDPAKVGYYIHPTGGSCDAADGTAATVSINVPVDSGVTATPSKLAFSKCGEANKQFVGFSGTKEGRYQITISVSDNSGTYNPNEATFFLSVGKAPEPAAPSDTTPPDITKVVTGTLGLNGWYTNDVNVDWTVTDNDSAISSQSGCDDFSVTTDQSATTYTCTATSAGGERSDSVTIKRDATAPTVTPGNVVDSVWRNSALSQAFRASDSTSGLANPADENFTLTASGESADATTPTFDSKQVSDNAGNSTTRSLSALIDLTAPTLDISGADSGDFNVCSIPARPTFNPSDALSGLNGRGSDSWTTPNSASGVGTYTYSAQATDNAGNPSNGGRTYNVSYGAAYGGVLQPINTNGSSIFKLGSTIPVKFQLTCTKDGVTTPITNAVAKLSLQKISTTPEGAVNEAVSTSAATEGSLFRYSDGQYIFNLATKGLSDGKYRLSIVLDDGTTQTVDLSLRK